MYWKLSKIAFKKTLLKILLWILMKRKMQCANQTTCKLKQNSAHPLNNNPHILAYVNINVNESHQK